MKQVFCRLCNARFDEKSVNSFHACPPCEDRASAEMSRLETIKKVVGVAAFIFFMILIMEIVFPLLAGPGANGFYRIKENKGPRFFQASLSGLLFVGSIIFAAGTIFSLIYFHLRRKLLKKDEELYRLPLQTD